MIEAELVDEQLHTLPARYNLAPTDPVGIAHRSAGQRRLSVARWGVPRRGGGVAINARDDRLRTGMWGPMMRRSRAVVPMLGFYEWQRPQRQPWYFARTDGTLLLMAGLVHEDPNGLHTTVITTTPSDDIGGIHDRMPAILEPDMIEPWLCGEDPQMLLAMIGPAATGTLRRHPVGKAVGNVRNDGPELIEAVSLPPVQAELF